jgi:hypothetical protein
VAASGSFLISEKSSNSVLMELTPQQILECKTNESGIQANENEKIN